ncbi:GGDEF domain-containing protein [Oceanospirillum beijerinckii]|uniref:GGDEF domain-containing protein n=1 Tax=Oceanospirillum beijerinckii TaxID=64976 RepID=UPI000414B989|nr:GGDEF domain-containing protein [Oceanospirillum beijerinckii]
MTGPESLSLGQRVRHLFELMKGYELLGAREHPSDFNQIRAEYINTRIRLLALLFSILTPLWIPVDYLILPEETFLDIVLARLVFSASLLALWVRASYVHSLYKARRRLVVLMVMPAFFHLSTQFILGEHLNNDYLASYTFLPILIIAIHCVFPLTLKEGVLLAFFTIVALSMDELVKRQLFSLTSLNNMWLLGVIMSIAIWAQLSQLHMQLKLFEQATTDALTGLLNRRSFMSQVETELSRSERYNRPLTMALFDLDFFKQVNDVYGHQAGDKVLVYFSELLREELRATDIIGRFGGEEFIVALPETPLSEAEQVINRVLQSCRDTVVEFDGREIHFTSSAGLGEVLVDVQSSMKLVDGALYEAKDRGRDQVALASGTARA